MILANTARKLGDMPGVQDQDQIRHRAALDRFFRDVERRALRMAQLGTGNIDDALELVQEAMLGFVRHYAGKPSADWAPLFYRVLDSRLLDFHRRQSVRRRWLSMSFASSPAEPDDAADPIADVADDQNIDPLQRYADESAMAALQAGLRALPDRQRQAFLLRHWEGFDGATTAGIMGCSEGSVKTHLSRALHGLRRSLEDHR